MKSRRAPRRSAPRSAVPGEGAAREPTTDTEDAAYLDPAEHLRDELWRVWLRAQYQIHRVWEFAALPLLQGQPARAPGMAEQLAGLFGMAQEEYAQGVSVPVDSGSRRLLDAFLRHSAQVQRRISATQRAGDTLPLLRIVRRFGLNRWQQEALTFALMPELDPGLLLCYRHLSQDPACRGLDARLLALLVYDTPALRTHLWRDLSPQSPLLRYRLLEHDEAPGPPDAMLYRRLRPAARLLQMLDGLGDDLDLQLADLAQCAGAPPVGGLFEEDIVQRAARALEDDGVLVLVQGAAGVGKRHLLRLAAARSGKRLLLIHGERLQGLPAELLGVTLRSLVREARLLDAVPVVPEIDRLVVRSEDREVLPPWIAALCALHEGAVALTVCGERAPEIDNRGAPAALALDLRPLVQLRLPLPNLAARRALWRAQVPLLSEDEVDALTQRFAVPGGTIVAAARAARATHAGQPAAPERTMAAELDLAVRDQLHERISRLGQRLEVTHHFDDLVVDHQVWDALWEIVCRVRERRRVREEWGFSGPPGVSALFSGEPGVGKTMSAKVLARELNLVLYEIDLARVVSKWIGETEKNLAEVFDAAEPGHVLLLFNEADSLFGKRTTEIRSANERYANLETNYLLQRLERFSGVAILTTNLGKAVDPAFRRRFAYDVQFSFPSAALRAELWARMIPAQAAVADLDFDELAARFELSGGFIRVAAERSAFVSAALGEALSMDTIIATIERMYEERGKLAGFGRLE